MSNRRFTLTAGIFLSLLLIPGLVSAQTVDTLVQRRRNLMDRIDSGIAVIQSTASNQENLLEFFVPNSDNHDFIYLTGLETPGATLILCPASIEVREILYIRGEPGDISRRTGIRHVFPPENLWDDLSNAYSDYALLRSTQLRFKPLPSEISRILSLGGGKKIIYYNFQRFVNLNEPPPERLELVRRLEIFSPDYEIRNICPSLDRVRMYHDAWAVAQLEEACRISGEAMTECMRSVTPGMNQDQLSTVFDFTCRFMGAKSFGFPTSIRSGEVRLEEHFPDSTLPLKEGDLVTIDAGAEINHYTADIQRTFPVSGRFTPEQARMYTILKKAQETCIHMVRPGITMRDLQETAIRVLDEEGGYGKYFRWGTSHFLGMEVHDHGDNQIPFEPGICITVEPGLSLDAFIIVLEDDVLCTEDGYEWLTEFIPREIKDIERVMREPGIGEVMLKKQR